MAQDYKCNLMLIIGLLVMLSELSRGAAVGTLDRNVKQELEQEQLPRAVRLLDRFNHRYPDGSYEFRFELDDGTARYERGYFGYVDEVKTLMVVGYYSYRMPDGRYITVFYNADQFGYRQNQSITPEIYPNLPRSIEVPELKETTKSGQKLQSQQSSASSSSSSHSSSSSFSAGGSQSSSYSSSSTPRTMAVPTRRGRF